MKKLITVAFALICMLVLGSGTPAATAQDEEDDGPGACELMEQAADTACKDVEDSVDDLANGHMSLGDFQRLAKRCKNFSKTYREECERS